jgi:hypothetical protein
MDNIPKRVFIIPYRNRAQQKFFFCKYMDFLLEGETDYEIYFSHQVDKKPFNRGATKNIGFLAVKAKYPDNYKDINFIFHDIDTVPFHKLFTYTTEPGIIKHYYGFDYALGGIVVIKGKDFETILGYPNFWGWGMEDNVLQMRVNKMKLTIDRTQFYKIGSPEIIQLFDGITRINKNDPWKAKNDDMRDGLHSIKNLNYVINAKSSNTVDNKYIINNSRIFFINILNFTTIMSPNKQEYYEYDLREPPRQIVNPNKVANLAMQFDKSGQINQQISFVPTANQKQNLINKYGSDNALKIIDYNKDNNFGDTLQIPPSVLYSKEYANRIGVKPLATASVNIGMGGVQYR